jgi:transposase
MVLKTFGITQKRHMIKFNGIPRQHFNLFLKECEWRFNIGAPSKLLVDLKSLIKEGY